jgi:sugar phosphate isomerase/epimerase
MNTLNRRDFLRTGAALGAATLLAPTLARAAAVSAFNLGSQSYSFRNFKFPACIDELKKLGLTQMEFCSVHFPPDAGHADFEKVKAAIAVAGITVPCYGVEGFGKDEAANRKKFEFAKAMGIQILTADPEPESFANLDKLTEEFGVKIAIHNHGPNARYNKVSDTLSAIKGHSPMIGACLDTGHCIRSNEKPHEAIEQLGASLIAMHMKDWIHGGKEQIIGKGDMDIVAVAKALKAMSFTGPMMFEYEESPDNPVPDMLVGLENWNKACTEA